MSFNFRIAEAIEKHKYGVLSFSTGKDSLALLHACSNWSNRIFVFMMDRGDSFPHLLNFAKEKCKEYGYRLFIIRPQVSVLDYVEKTGLPSDIVPMLSTEFATNMHNVDQKIQPTMACCSAMFWQPFYNAVIDSNLTLIIRGSKKHDPHKSAPDGFISDNIEICCPLWDLTDDDVFSYLEENNVVLPHQYYHGVNTSMDCMECTGGLDTEEERARIGYIKKFYPQKYEKLRIKLLKVSNEVNKQMTGLNLAVAEVA